MQTTQQSSVNSCFGKRLDGLRRFFGGIGQYSLGKKYELELSLYPDEESNAPICSHHFDGSSRHNLAKTIALAALVMLFFAVLMPILRAVGCAFSKIFKA